MYDVIIIGAGPAGVFSATELVRKGYHVCILEKQKKNYRKVCGDGISGICTKVLQCMDFPVERLEKAGAVKIEEYHYYRDGKLYTEQVKEKGKVAYGLSRDITDKVFQEYAAVDFGVPIYYNHEVKNIETIKNGYQIGDITGEKIIISTGVNDSVKLDGTLLIKTDPKRPVGISVIAKGKPCEKPFFLFDYKKKYRGTYGWIFTIKRDCYNVGLWLKERPEDLRWMFQEFCDERAGEWLGEMPSMCSPIRGAFLGIGARNLPFHKGIYFAGDAAGSCNKEDGEGISRAVLSAKELVREKF